MKTLLAHFFFLAVFCGLAGGAPLPLTQSTFTEIINDVNVVSAATQAVTPAKTNEVFRVPDLVRTGPNSRVEMEAPDKTVTRIGSDTVFTFAQGGRNILLDRGSVLFHSPAGQGGGSIISGGSSASVLGTTIICVTLADGTFRTIVLEGKATVKLKDGQSVVLQAGQTVSVTPSGTFSTVMNFDLEKLISHLLLIKGFSHELDSMPLIEAAIKKQLEEINDGTIGPLEQLSLVSLGLDLIGGPTVFFEDRIFFQDHTTIFISPDI
jgi:hypothetical protein